MEKVKIRQQMLDTLKKFQREQPEQKRKCEQALCHAICQTSVFQQARTVALTYALDFEVDTGLLQQACWQAGKTVVMPVSAAKQTLKFYPVEPEDQQVPTTFGVLEPDTTGKSAIARKKIDLVIVPGFVYNAKGYRVGFGGGFYDRFLAGFKGATISQAFAFQAVDGWPVEATDVPVQQIIYKGWQEK